MSYETPARDYAPGMGQAVADRTINRKITRPCMPYLEGMVIPRNDSMSLDDQVANEAKSRGLVIDSYHVIAGDDLSVDVSMTVSATVGTEKWADVAHRVSMGNSMLHPVAAGAAAVYGIARQQREFESMHHHLRQASLLMSGRHLQHGDETQPTRNMEVFTNCSTAAVSFLSFYLLLNGSGVGRSYDDAMIIADLNDMPIVVCAIDQNHADVLSGEIKAMDRRHVEHLYEQARRVVFEVPDSREGWAKAIEQIERMAAQGLRDTVLILEFTKVRCKGSPIGGMQDRPASGPGPLMAAIDKVAKLRDAGMEPWRAALYADHYLAECVLVGGARRAARMATKYWKDPTIFGFIGVKRGGFLWSSNNSVVVDEEFWEAVKLRERAGTDFYNLATPLEIHAVNVFDAVCKAAYFDKTGEPGFITGDKLTHSDEGIEQFFDGDFAKSARYQLDEDTKLLMADLAQAWKSCPVKVITNPCGEIVLIMLGGYCVIADVVPFHAFYALRQAADMNRFDQLLPHELGLWDDDAEDAFRVATRALIRTNLMDSLYSKEVKRTNRIGVGMTGLHSYAFARFGFGFRDIIDEEKSKAFWLTLSRFKRAVQDEACKYAGELGVAVPMTDTTMKPAGTTSKLFGLEEGAHLPSMREFLRWVQFRNGDPLIDQYRAQGYPVRELKIYSGTTIVGFPTAPTICSLGMGDKLVTAAEATPEEQYRYLQLLEKYWITGVEEDGVTPLRETGNQVSYTLKYDPTKVSYEEFRRTLLDGQSTIRCCSVMPQADTSAYEYQPEQPVTKAEYEAIAEAIGAADLKEDVGLEHVGCGTNGCPIDFGTNSASS